MTSETELSRCKEDRAREVDRYYQTVLLTIGLKDYLDDRAKGCRFVSAERRFFTEKRDEVNPDVVLQYGSNNTSDYGVLCEIKTSLPFVEGYLIDSLKQIERYSQDVTGWDTENRRVKNHDILLLCHALDSDRVIRGMQGWLNDGTLNISRKLCVCEWSTITSTKSVTDVILIKQRFGSTNCDELNSMLQENIVIDIQKIPVEYEKCKFTRKEPPIEYTMQELWLNVFTMNSENKDFEIALDEILKIVIDYYIPWSNIEGEYSQVRRSWIRKAMEGFCSIGLAERNESDPNKFGIFRGKQIQKDILDYIIESLCNLTIRQAVKKTVIGEETTKTQKPLSAFSGKDGEDQSS